MKNLKVNSFPIYFSQLAIKFEQKSHDFNNILFEVSQLYRKTVISLLATEWRNNE
jgi:hypothetical protein